MLSRIGKVLNDLTGATSAGKQSQQYALQSAVLNNQYQKEFAQNAHQWEIEDLKKAGLNPVLSANSGASASGGGVNSASVASAGENPISLGIGAWNGIQNALKVEKEKKLLESQAKNTDADTLLKKAQGINQMSQSNLTQYQRGLLRAQTNEILETLPLVKEEKQQGIKESKTGTTGKILGTDIAETGLQGAKDFYTKAGDYAHELKEEYEKRKRRFTTNLRAAKYYFTHKKW